MDPSQVDNFDVGKQMVRFLAPEDVNWILHKAGADDFYGIGLRTLRAGSEVYGSFDFAPNFLIPNIRGKDGAEGMIYEDNKEEDYKDWDSNGGFIYFIGSNFGNNRPVLYNIPDAGNFLFAAAADRLGISYPEIIFFDQAHEMARSILLTPHFDSKADLSAIKRGYVYDNFLRGSTGKYLPYMGFLFGYERKRPSWFDPKLESWDGSKPVLIRVC